MQSKIGILIVLAGVAGAGCSKPAAPAVHQFAKQEEQQPPNPPSTPGTDWQNSPANPESSLPPAPAATPAPELTFSNPAANSAWNTYVDSFESVRSVPPPPASELGDPSAISAHINEINRRLGILQESRAALQNSLTSPEDKKRFRAAEESLNGSSQ